MSVLVFIELADGEVKKSSLEAVYYGKELADAMGGKATVLAIGKADNATLAALGNYGAAKVLHATEGELETPSIMAYSQVLTAAAQQTGATVVVAAKSSLGDAVMARTSGALKAGIVGNVVSLPDLSNGFTVKRSIFTGKAFANTSISTAVKMLCLKKSAITPIESSGTAEVEPFSASLSANALVAEVKEISKAADGVPLPEADLVVSGGRGMQGPDQWQPLLDLAEALGAATACSKPVSDLDWRPHHEHVGQTGVKIAPNLYIACGISGAIQHLAGVNASKTIVVINKDPEAPFFQAADYGIVGDVFEVLPQLTAAVKALK